MPDRVSLPALMRKDFDGRRLRLGMSRASTPTYTRYAVTYRGGDLTISGIMNVPDGDGPFPVLVLNHGYIDPAYYVTGQGLAREQDFLAGRGYVVLHTDYRNHAGSDDDDRGAPDEVGLHRGRDQRGPGRRGHRCRFSTATAWDCSAVRWAVAMMPIALVVRPGLVDAATVYASVSSRRSTTSTSGSGTTLAGPRSVTTSSTGGASRVRIPHSAGEAYPVATSPASPSRSSCRDRRRELSAALGVRDKARPGGR